MKLCLSAATRGVAMVGTTALITGTALMGLGATAKAADGGVYTLAGRAVAVQSVYQSLNVPFGLPFVVGSYGASANMGTTGNTADAGAPYSPLVASLPGAGNGVASLSGAQLPVVPAFPGYVTAQFPSKPTGVQQAGIYDLSATTGEREAQGRVSIGGQGLATSKNNLFALARTATADGALAVDATAGAVALSLPGILDLFNVSSEIHAVRAIGDTQPTFTTATALGTISLAGANSGITGSSAQIAGADAVPITMDALPALNQALAPMGVSLAYLPASFVYTDGTYSTGAQPEAKKTLRGLTSAALQILIQGELPDQGVSTETITVGQVSVSLEGDALALSSAGPSGAGVTDGSSTGLGADGTAGSPGSGVDAAGLLPATSGALPGTALESPVAGAAPAAVSTGLPQNDRVRAVLTQFERLDFSTMGAFGLLALVGGAMLAGSVLTRLVAVRLVSLGNR